MHSENAPEQFGLDTEDLDEGLIESQNFRIDLGLSQLHEVGMGPGMACFVKMSSIDSIGLKIRTRKLMAALVCITQGLNIRLGVDATPVVSVDDW